MKKLYTVFLLVLLAALLGVGIYSLADQDAAGSASEKREFVRPEFSVRALLDGTYIPALEQYYSDTFPGRETLLNANRTLNKFYYYSGSGEDSVLIVNQTDAAAHGGEALDAVQVGAFSLDALLERTEALRERAEIVITGHEAPEALLLRADYITRMQKFRHPYDHGVRARRGIEY